MVARWRSNLALIALRRPWPGLNANALQRWASRARLVENVRPPLGFQGSGLPNSLRCMCQLVGNQGQLSLRQEAFEVSALPLNRENADITIEMCKKAAHFCGVCKLFNDSTQFTSCGLGSASR
jgi:hypothetical protein